MESLNNKKRSFNNDDSPISNSNINLELDNFTNIKKQKINNQIDKEINNLNSLLNELDINFDFYLIKNLDSNFNLSLNLNFDNSELNLNKLDLVSETTETEHEHIKIKNNLKNIKQNMDYFKSIKNIFDNLNYDNLCLIANSLANKIGKENIIDGTINDEQINDIIWNFITFKLYPSLIFANENIDPDFKSKYVDERITSLEQIHPDTISFFPSWKKKYNYDIDYNFPINPINLRISKNFLKKIFLFYEILHNFYFDLIIGELFGWIINNYKINVNPFDNNFNKNKFNDWAEKFNQVILNCKIFIRELYIKYKICDIDDFNKDELVKIIDQFKQEFILNYNDTREKIEFIFIPLYQYKNNSKIYQFKSSKCFYNIEKEIDYVFRIKYCYKNIVGNQWITKFLF